MQVNLFTGIAKLLMAAALLFFLIALGASYWIKLGSAHQGLWQQCADGTSGCNDIDSECKIQGSKITTVSTLLHDEHVRDGRYPVTV